MREDDGRVTITQAGQRRHATEVLRLSMFRTEVR